MSSLFHRSVRCLFSFYYINNIHLPDYLAIHLFVYTVCIHYLLRIYPKYFLKFRYYFSVSDIYPIYNSSVEYFSPIGLPFIIYFIYTVNKGPFTFNFRDVEVVLSTFLFVFDCNGQLFEESIQRFPTDLTMFAKPLNKSCHMISVRKKTGY